MFSSNRTHCVDTVADGLARCRTCRKGSRLEPVEVKDRWRRRGLLHAHHVVDGYERSGVGSHIESLQVIRVVAVGAGHLADHLVLLSFFGEVAKPQVAVGKLKRLRDILYTDTKL